MTRRILKEKNKNSKISSGWKEISKTSLKFKTTSFYKIIWRDLPNAEMKRRFRIIRNTKEMDNQIKLGKIITAADAKQTGSMCNAQLEFAN